MKLTYDQCKLIRLELAAGKSFVLAVHFACDELDDMPRGTMDELMKWHGVVTDLESQYAAWEQQTAESNRVEYLLVLNQHPLVHGLEVKTKQK